MDEKKFGSTLQTLDRLRKSGDLAALTRKNRPGPTGPRDIPLADIVADPDQPRRHFDQGQLASLADSIRRQGVLQAITVQPADGAGKHMIIMGERRFQAAKLAGLVRIPAVVREMTEALRLAQLTENVQRADLTTLEVAEAVAALRAAGQPRGAIAAALGWNEGEVSRFAALARMPEALRRVAAQNAPIRALSDLYALWKKDEAAVRAFLARTEPAEISRVTVERLRAEIESAQSSPAPEPHDPQMLRGGGPDAAVLTEAETPAAGAAEKQARDVRGKRSIGAAGDRVSLLVRHNGVLGEALLDQPASDRTLLLVSFADGAQVEEVPLAGVELVEVLRR